MFLIAFPRPEKPTSDAAQIGAQSRFLCEKSEWKTDIKK
jgi:hypothetical protein